MLKGLYVIADTQSIRARDFLDTVESVLSVGTRIIQYRDKVNDLETRTVIGHKLRSLTRKHKSLLIINDDIELTRDIDADGVHLGKEDHGISETGTFLGAEKIIGASCYNEYGNAVQAVADGAAYIAFGSFFTSPTKPSAPLADTGPDYSRQTGTEYPGLCNWRHYPGQCHATFACRCRHDCCHQWDLQLIFPCPVRAGIPDPVTAFSISPMTRITITIFPFTTSRLQ